MPADAPAPAAAVAAPRPNVAAQQCALAGAALAAAIWLQPLERHQDRGSSAGVQTSTSE